MYLFCWWGLPFDETHGAFCPVPFRDQLVEHHAVPAIWICSLILQERAGVYPTTPCQPWQLFIPSFLFTDPCFTLVHPITSSYVALLESLFSAFSICLETKITFCQQNHWFIGQTCFNLASENNYKINLFKTRVNNKDISGNPIVKQEKMAWLKVHVYD